jgi:hypothetical protein
VKKWCECSDRSECFVPPILDQQAVVGRANKKFSKKFTRWCRKDEERLLLALSNCLMRDKLVLRPTIASSFNEQFSCAASAHPFYSSY